MFFSAYLHYAVISITALCNGTMCSHYSRNSLAVQLVRNLSAVQETWVRSLVWEDPLDPLQYYCLENPMD